MSSLPDIVCGQLRCRLPLSGEAAACLAGALLADARSTRLAWLSRGLLRDPSLALWCAVQSPLPVGTRADLATLSAWLAGRLKVDFAHMAGAASPIASPAQPEPRDAAAQDSLPDSQSVMGMAELLAHARGVASAASQAPGVDADTVLLALLHRAVDMLVLAADRQLQPAAARALLPDWLAQSLVRIESGNCLAGSVEARVRAAIVVVSDRARNHFAAPVAESLQPSAESKASDATAETALAQLLPQMAARLARLDELESNFDRAVEQAKLEALKEFAYGAGHEINNPLANISARAQTLLKDEPDPERRQKLAAINTQAFRAHEMIADLMLFARPPILEPQPIELRSYLSELAASWQAQAAEQKTAVELRVVEETGDAATAEKLVVLADRNALSVALRALMTNALEALGRGGRVEVIAERAREAGPNGLSLTAHAGQVEIRVRDNGPGIPADVRARIFDPYFSGREAGRGLGFGLCKCWRIVTLLGGRIDVASDVGAGATFCVTLPAAPVAG